MRQNMCQLKVLTLAVYLAVALASVVEPNSKATQRSELDGRLGCLEPVLTGCGKLLQRKAACLDCVKVGLGKCSLGQIVNFAAAVCRPEAKAELNSLMASGMLWPTGLVGEQLGCLFNGLTSCRTGVSSRKRHGCLVCASDIFRLCSVSPIGLFGDALCKGKN